MRYLLLLVLLCGCSSEPPLRDFAESLVPRFCPGSKDYAEVSDVNLIKSDSISYPYEGVVEYKVETHDAFLRSFTAPGKTYPCTILSEAELSLRWSDDRGQWEFVSGSLRLKHCLSSDDLPADARLLTGPLNTVINYKSLGQGSLMMLPKAYRWEYSDWVQVYNKITLRRTQRETSRIIDETLRKIRGRG